MRLAVVAPRYGLDVAGGAERLARELAEGLARRGHEVRVLTTCARRYDSWANELDPGEQYVGGVVVERHPVAIIRPDATFLRLLARVLGASTPAPELTCELLRLQGPWAPGIPEALRRIAPQTDAVVVMPYLYWPALASIEVARSAGVPSLLVPAAHDEPTLRIPGLRALFAGADAIAYLTAEEAALVRRWFPRRAPGAVLGAGVTPGAADKGDIARVRAVYGIGARPYLAVVGRLEPAKGSDEIVQQFVAYRERNPERDLGLVVVGEPVHPVAAHPDVTVCGFVPEADKDALVAGALALVQPSYFESFSLALCEAWALGVPALVNGRCAVLDGQVRRSGGGLAYRGFAEFEAGLDLLLDEPALRSRLATQGRAYVAHAYEPAAVLDRYERVLCALSGS